MTFLQPKRKGDGIMVSDFIDEQNGYLQLTEEEFSRAKEIIPDLKRYAECKYPRDQGYRLVLIF